MAQGSGLAWLRSVQRSYPLVLDRPSSDGCLEALLDPSRQPS